MEYEYPFKETSETLLKLVWDKGEIIPHYSASIWRWDKYGKVIRYNNHGDTKSKFGWEIDHIYPKLLGGTDDPVNLQPLHWENNRSKGDSIMWDGNKQLFANVDPGLLISWINRNINKLNFNIPKFLRSIKRKSIYH
jgi:HNH endonuclease